MKQQREYGERWPFFVTKVILGKREIADQKNFPPLDRIGFESRGSFGAVGKR